MEQFIDQTSSTYSESISNFFESKELILSILSEHPTIVDFFKDASENTSNITKDQDYHTTIDLLNTFIEKDSAIAHISLSVPNSKTIIYSTGKIITTNFYESFNQINFSETQAVYLTEPYVDVNSDQELLGIAIPVYEDNTLIGICAIHIKLDDMYHELHGLFKAPGILPVIYNNDGLILYDQNSNYINVYSLIDYPNPKLQDDRPLLFDLISSKSESKRFENNNFLIYDKNFEHSNLNLAIIYDKDILHFPARNAVGKMVLTLLSILIAISLILNFIFRNLFKKISDVLSHLDKVSEGHLSHITVDKAPVELVALTNSYNGMIDSLVDLTKNIMIISANIHQFTTSLTDNANASTQTNSQISNSMIKMSSEISTEVDSIQNVIFLSKSISSQIEIILTLTKQISLRNFDAQEIVTEANDRIQILKQRATINNLSLENLQNLFLSSHNTETQSNHESISFQSAINDSVEINSSIINSINELNEIQLTLESIINQTTKDLQQFITAMQFIDKKRNIIESSLSSLNHSSSQSTEIIDSVLKEVDRQNESNQNLAKEITNLYRTSLHLNNQVSKFKLPPE